MLADYKGRSVTLICRILREENNMVMTSDNQRVEVYPPPGDSLANYKDFVQLIGKVKDQGGLALEVWRMHDCGESFDMEAYNSAVLLANGDKYRSLFYN